MYSVSFVCSISATTGEKDFFKGIADCFAALGFCDIFGDGAASFSQRSKGRLPFSFFFIFLVRCTHSYKGHFLKDSSLSMLSSLIGYIIQYVYWHQIYDEALIYLIKYYLIKIIINLIIGTSTTHWTGLLFTTALQPAQSSMNFHESMGWSKTIIKWALRSPDLVLCDFSPSETHCIFRETH